MVPNGARVTAFTVSELLWETNWRKGGKITPDPPRLGLSTRMELYRDICKMFKPSFLIHSTRSQMSLDIPLRKKNTGQKRLSFFGPKIWSKINPS